MPPYRTCFSKRQFSQPQLLAILCFMRYEDWTFRETEVRLSEHGELRRALALASVPDYTTLQPFLRRLLEPDLEHALEDSRASRGAGEAAKANHGGRRCHRACPRRGEHVLSAAHVSPHPAALPWRRWLIRAVAVQKGMPYCFASPWFRSCQHCCKRGRGLHQRPESDAGRYGNIVCPPHGQ